jgi:hypothetical protein
MGADVVVTSPKNIARDIMYEAARDVEFLSVVEFLRDEYPEMLPDVRAALAARVHGLISDANVDVVVEWPG